MPVKSYNFGLMAWQAKRDLQECVGHGNILIKRKNSQYKVFNRSIKK